MQRALRLGSLLRIRVVGVGNGGIRAVNHMMASGVKHVDFIAIDTDEEVLTNSRAVTRLLIGTDPCRHLGTTGNVVKGQQAAREAASEIYQILLDSDMVLITAGMDGGMGTGAAPVAAQIANNIGALTVAVVTQSLTRQSQHLVATVNQCLSQLQRFTDTLIVIPNEQMLVDSKTSDSSFYLVNDYLGRGIKMLTETITSPGLINLDIADMRTIMSGGGRGFLAIGRGYGNDRAMVAAEQAVWSRMSGRGLDGACRVLLHITGGPNLSLHEVHCVASFIMEKVHLEANLIFGATIEEEMGDEIQVAIIAI